MSVSGLLTKVVNQARNIFFGDLSAGISAHRVAQKFGRVRWQGACRLVRCQQIVQALIRQHNLEPARVQ